MKKNSFGKKQSMYESNIILMRYIKQIILSQFSINIKSIHTQVLFIMENNLIIEKEKVLIFAVW